MQTVSFDISSLYRTGKNLSGSFRIQFVRQYNRILRILRGLFFIRSLLNVLVVSLSLLLPLLLCSFSAPYANIQDSVTAKVIPNATTQSGPVSPVNSTMPNPTANIVMTNIQIEAVQRMIR